MRWRLKGLIQAALGVVPGGGHLHYRLQRGLCGLRDFGQECEVKLWDLSLMIEHLGAVGVGIAGTRFVEIGTGWYPTFPLALAALGAARVDTYDQQRHLRRELVDALLAHAPRYCGWVGSAARVDLDLLRERLTRFAATHHARDPDAHDVAAWTDGIVQYHAPADAAATGLPPGSVDVVFSNSVLEHVPEDGIVAIYREARRILRPGGVMFHSVNCGDHYAYVDRSISQLNYLRYSDAEWARWNNGFLYQNRLRAEAFTRLARGAGFAIIRDVSPVKPVRLAQLGRVPVHPQFAHLSREQLCITSSDFIAQQPSAP